MARTVPARTATRPPVTPDLPHFTNTSDPASTGDGVIEFRAAGATLTLGPGESGVLDPGEVSPDTPWEVVFFDLGEPYVFDGGTFGVCQSPTTTLTYSLSVAEGCTDGEPVVNFTNTGTGMIHASIGTLRPAGRSGGDRRGVLANGAGRPEPAGRLARLRVPRPAGRHRTGVRHRHGVPGSTPAVSRPAPSIVPTASSATSCAAPSDPDQQSRRRAPAASCSSDRQAGTTVRRIWKPTSTWWMQTGVNVTSSCCSPMDGAGRWSPDGSEVSIFCCGDPAMVAHLVEVATGDVRAVATPDPTLELDCGFGWSPDGERLICEGYGIDDPEPQRHLLGARRPTVAT